MGPAREDEAEVCKRTDSRESVKGTLCGGKQRMYLHGLRNVIWKEEAGDRFGHVESDEVTKRVPEQIELHPDVMRRVVLLQRIFD